MEQLRSLSAVLQSEKKKLREAIAALLHGDEAAILEASSAKKEAQRAQTKLEEEKAKFSGILQREHEQCQDVIASMKDKSKAAVQKECQIGHEAKEKEKQRSLSLIAKVAKRSEDAVAKLSHAKD
jgi:hypothetical protein